MRQAEFGTQVSSQGVGKGEAKKPKTMSAYTRKNGGTLDNGDKAEHTDLIHTGE